MGHFIGQLSFIWLGLTLINKVLEGVFVGASEAAFLNALTVFREVSVFDLFTLPVPNLSFITDGLPRLVMWDYSFFGGPMAIFTYFLYSLTAILSFTLFTLILGLLYNYFGRAKTG